MRSPPPATSVSHSGSGPAVLHTASRSRLRDALFTAYRHVQQAVRDDRRKRLVYPQVNKVQLFDLANDPAERKDLSADPAHAAEVRRLMGLWKGWQKQLGDTQPPRTDRPEPLEFDFRKVKPPKTAKK